MLNKFLMLLNGAARVRVRGVFIERFINLVSRDGIRIWDIERREGEMFFTVRASLFSHLRRAARAAGVRVKVVGRSGLPFVYNRYKGRTALWFGGLIFVLAIYGANLFLWDIEIVGGVDVDQEALLSVLEQHGVKRGAYIDGIDVTEVSRLAMIDMEELSFIAINIKGVEATVEIRERVPVPDFLTPEGLRSIAAAKDGVIESIDVFKGTTLVARGDVVQRGDILVSGEIASETGETRFVAADAKITGRTWRHGVITASREATARIYTGESKSRYTLNLPFGDIKLYINSGIPWVEYDRIVNEYAPTVFGVNIPITLTVEMFGEVELLTRVQTDEELKSLCLEKLAETVETVGQEVEIVDVVHEIKTDDSGMTLTFEIEIIEEIGEPIPLY